MFKSEYLRLMIFGIFVVLLASDVLTAGEPDSTRDAPIIYAIQVIGNQTTATELILREMSLKPGMRATLEAMRKDQLNIASLGLFNRVKLQLASDEGRAVVQVEVTEPFYFYPYIFSDYDFINPDSAFLGLGVYHPNFRGLGMRLGGAVWTGYRNGFSIYFDDRWFSINNKYGLKSNVYYDDSETKDPYRGVFKREVWVFSWGMRRRLGHNRHSLEFEMGWATVFANADDYTLTHGERDRIIIFKIQLENDLRDYRYYPTSGTYTLFELRANRLVDIPHDFFIEKIDLRRYRTFNSFIFAARIWSQMGQYKLPEYWWIEVKRSYIRAGDIFSFPKGTVFGGNLEIRFNILKKRYFSLDYAPLIGPYLRNIKFSIEGVFFGDVGFHTVMIPEIEKRFHAYGCGLQFQLPFINTIHILSGWTLSSRFGKPSITLRSNVTF